MNKVVKAKISESLRISASYSRPMSYKQRGHASRLFGDRTVAVGCSEWRMNATGVEVTLQAMTAANAATRWNWSMGSSNRVEYIADSSDMSVESLSMLVGRCCPIIDWD